MGAAGDAGRLLGVDAARGLAIVGMLFAHAAMDPPGEHLYDGRSSVLFATLAGMSLGLLTGGARPPGRAGTTAGLLRVAIRGVLLVLLGLGLWSLGTPIWVILDYYGVLFLVLLPVLFAPRWVLALVAAAAAVLGTRVVAIVGEDDSTPFSSLRLTEIVGEWFVTGCYPVVAWAAYACVGLIAARSDLARRGTQLAMVAVGAAASVAGYGGARLLGFDASAHANTMWEVLGSGGLALAVVGLLQLLFGLPALAPAPRVLLAPLTAMGAMALTIYTAQIFAFALWRLVPGPQGGPQSIGSWPLLTGLLVGSAAFALLWRHFVGQGPLEATMSTITRLPTMTIPLTGPSASVPSSSSAPPPSSARTSTGTSGPPSAEQPTDAASDRSS